jgi:hypothetical protein
MKIIFLDIDGVLNCKTTDNPRKFPYFIDKKLLARLRGLIDATGALIVLSSTWRLDPIGVMAARHFGIPIFDLSPDMPGDARFKEIKAWLSAHPGVERYAVIDDEDDDIDGLPLFQPSSKTGLNEEIVQGVAAYLNGESDRTMRNNRVIRVFQGIYSLFKRDKS